MVTPNEAGVQSHPPFQDGVSFLFEQNELVKFLVCLGFFVC